MQSQEIPSQEREIDISNDTDSLLNRIQRGEGEATSQLLDQYRDRLRHMIRVRMDPRVIARVDPSDVIQEAMATAVRRLPEYATTQPIPFYPWLRRIAWDKLQHVHEQHIDAEKRTVRREQARWQMTDESVSQLAKIAVGEITGPSSAAIREESCRQLRRALEGLADADREILVQRYLEHLSVREIAAGENTSEASIRMRNLRALRRLKSFLPQGEQS